MRSPFVITRDHVCELLELFPLVIHGAATERKWANELSDGQWALIKSVLSEVSEDLFARLLDRAG